MQGNCIIAHQYIMIEVQLHRGVSLLKLKARDDLDDVGVGRRLLYIGYSRNRMGVVDWIDLAQD
jgi:hypothetical protein